MAKSLNSKMKSKAWDEFSRFIRIRGCLKATGLAFVGVCITCERKFHIRYLQAGHCFPGRRNAVLLDERLVNPQCRYCNEYKHGEREKYEAAMIKKYGKVKFEKMKIESKKIIHDCDMDFESLAKKYTKKTNELLREHGYKTYSELLKEGN